MSTYIRKLREFLPVYDSILKNEPVDSEQVKTIVSLFRETNFGGEATYLFGSTRTRSSHKDPEQIKEILRKNYPTKEAFIIGFLGLNSWKEKGPKKKEAISRIVEEIKRGEKSINLTNLGFKSVPRSLVTLLLQPHRGINAVPKPPPIDPLTVIDTTNDSLGIVKAAIKYFGKLKWVVSDEKYVERDNQHNDFILHFLPGQISLNVHEKVKEKFQNTKETPSILTEENQPTMNCWQFCYLSLMDANIVNAEQVKKILLSWDSTKNSSKLISALTYEDFKQYPHQPDIPLQPGDIILYGLNKVHHAAIYAGNNSIIELVDTHVECNDMWGREDEMGNLYIIPRDQIAINIDKYIEKNPPILEMSELTAQEINQSLARTIYAPYLNKIED